MSVLSTGTGALLAFQRALSTVSHNVANVNTEGYTRQRVDFAARNPSDRGYGYVGNGTQVADIRRMADDLATSRLLDSGGELARLQQISSLSGRLDSLFSDGATNLAGVWSNFFDSVSALSSNAAGAAERQNVLSEAGMLASRFRQLDGQLRSLDGEVNNSLSAGASEITRLAAEVARINGVIGSDASKAAPDLLDRRDQLVSELVGYTGGTAVLQDGGALNVFTAGGQPLVVGGQASTLGTVPDPYRPERLQLTVEGGGTRTLLDQRALGGRIGGLLEFRASVLDPAAAELGRIAVAMASTFNEGHAAGMDLYGTLGGRFFDVPAPVATRHAANTGTASIQAQVADIGALTGQDLVLRLGDGGWSALDPGTGQPVPMTGSGTAADPFRVGGMSVVVDGAAQPGDRFLLQPTSRAAGALGVAISDPSRLAAASPVQGKAALSNLGSGVLAGLRVDDATNPALLQEAVVEFLDAGQYMLDGAGPFPFTPGQRISGNGWSVTLDGMPTAGDQFTIARTGPGSGDNGNAARLANLDDARVVSGGTMSLNGAVGGLTTMVGSAARQAEYAAEAQQVIHDDARATRDAVAGVNLDEEAANMLRLQQAYQAAAQIISTADTMFQSILSAVRR